jgi:GNAT superfamily N-acetyltransferase
MADLRPATPEDADAIGDVWFAAWKDGHLGLVPEELVRVRTPESFRERAAGKVPGATVAEVEGGIAGFIVVADDEVEQVFVAAEHRGSGIAAKLLTAAEEQLSASGHETAWLAVVPGNARARAFYEREGWRDDGALEYEAAGPDGPIAVPTRRYVKGL